MTKISRKIQGFLRASKIAVQKHVKSLILWAFVSVAWFPQITELQTVNVENSLAPVVDQKIATYREGPVLPQIAKKEPRKTMVMTVTAYSSEPEQTDDTPFITAFGTHVRDGIVATNCLPRGTVVRFPEVYGDKEFVVEDRMNARYYYRMDIWMPETEQAIQFGAKLLKVEIL